MNIILINHIFTYIEIGNKEFIYPSNTDEDYQNVKYRMDGNL